MVFKLRPPNIYFLPIVILFLIVNAKTASTGDIEVSDAWARESLVAGRPGAVYLTITNNKDKPITLLGAHTPISKVVRMHESYTENRIIKMRSIDKVTIAPSTQFILQPRGFHFMLMSLDQFLRAKETFPLTLFFEESEELSVQVTVAKHSRKSKTKEQKHHEH